MSIACDKWAIFIRHTVTFRAGHFGIYQMVVRAIDGKCVEYSGTNNTAMCLNYISVHYLGHGFFFLPLINFGDQSILR
jgi:hypothetical protein